MTKHQISAEVVIVVSFSNEIRTGCPLFSLERNNNKKFSWYLVCSQWFLVNGLSNGKDIYLGNIISSFNDLSRIISPYKISLNICGLFSRAAFIQDKKNLDKMIKKLNSMQTCPGPLCSFL